jgi:hypothetical protein
VTPAANERELAARASQLAGAWNALTTAERDLVVLRPTIREADLATLRQQIRNGMDPLGLDFIRLRGADVRRSRGAVYTPAAIIDAMIDWASAEPGETPARIVDPGSGSGRFLMPPPAPSPRPRSSPSKSILSRR